MLARTRSNANENKATRIVLVSLLFDFIARFYSPVETSRISHGSRTSNPGSNRFISENGLRTVPGRFPRSCSTYSLALNRAESRQAFHTVVSFHFVAVSHQWLLELRGVSKSSYVQGDSSAISPHNQPTAKRQVHVCGVISIANARFFIMKKKKVCPSQLRIQPYSGSFTHLTQVPKSDYITVFQTPGPKESNGDHQKSTSKTR